MQRDQRKIAVQEICPTSGHKLGTQGQPIKVKVGKETVFLCCKGCLKQRLNPQHWATIHANFAKAQQVCPVMEHELPKNPKWTIVEGQIVGGIAQGVGQALWEHGVYDESGQLLSGSMMDYTMPRADGLPTIAVDRIETPSPHNPLGVKGAGEMGTIAGTVTTQPSIEVQSSANSSS